MKQIFLKMAVFMLLMVCAVCGYAGEFPKPNGYVNDFAGIMDPAIIKKLADRVRNYEKATSYEIAVVTIPDLGGHPISDYAIYLFKEWGIGKKGFDNGILLLIAPNEPKGATKAWIVNGRGVEDVVTDLKSGRIVTETMKPLWKEGKKGEAIFAGVEKIISVLGNTPFEKKLEEKRKAEALAAQEKQLRKQQMATALMISAIVAVVGGVMVFIVWSIRKRAQRREEERKYFETVQSGTLSCRKDVAMAIGNFLNKYVMLEEEIKKHENFFADNEKHEIREEMKRMQISVKGIEHELPREEEIATSDIFKLDDLQSKISNLNFDARRYLYAIDSELSRIQSIVKAAKSIPDLLVEMDNLVVEVTKKVVHKDVSNETRSALREFRTEGIRDAIEDKKPSEVDWLKVGKTLNDSIAFLQGVRESARNEIEFAEQAREHGPQLFKKTPQFILKAEEAVLRNGGGGPDIKKRLDKVRDANHQATILTIFSQADIVNWVMIYPLLLMIEKETKGIISSVEKYQAEKERLLRQKEERRKDEEKRKSASLVNDNDDDWRRSSSSSSSSSWSFSDSSSSSSSSFGGGDTGGGGGGGSLD